jgi:HAE1 family hydrophobic/amphiphilic exporter-1
MASFGLVLYDVAESVRSSVSGGEAGGFYGFERRCDILVKPVLGNGENILNDVSFKNPEGKIIPLVSFADLKHQTGLVKIIRKEQKRCVPVVISASGNSFSQIESLIKKIKLPVGVTASLSSEAVEGNESLNQVMIFALVSVILIYMILSSQFESMRQPVIIMLSVPLTISGISLALLITGNSLNIISGMGIIMLAGLAVNNAILLFDKIQKNRDTGMELEKSILNASSERLRPILISTAVTMIDILPLAIGLQDGGEMQSPLAVAVIGGLISSTFLILVVLPSYYYKMESIT